MTQAVTTSAAGSVSYSSATLNGNVTTLGVCPASTEKGFVYSVTATNASPTVGGTGVTKVAVGSISTGTYNTGLSGLPSSTQYSFTAYVYDGTTYTYGTTLTFITLDALTLSGTLAHGSVCPGTAAASKSYTITNNSISAVTGVSVSSNDAQFVVSGLSSTTIAASGGTATYNVTFTPASAGAKSATITVSAADAASVSNTVTGTGTTPVTPSVSIASSPAAVAGTTTICSGTSVTFTPTPTNLGGGTATYEWFKNGVSQGTSATYVSSTLVTNDVITCTLSVSGGCVTATTANSNAITMVVNPTVTPSVSIAVTTGTNPTCTGNSLTLTATPTNGGASPTYQWKNGATNIGTGATYSNSSIADGSSITCVMTSNASCVSPTTATSTPIIITNNTPAQPSVISGTTNITPPQSGIAYSVTNVSGVSYTWTYSGTGVSVASGQGTNSITLDFANGATSGTLTVTPTYSGCTGTARTFPINIVPINDECSGAITLTPSADLSCSGITGTIAGATQSIAPVTTNTGTSATTIADVWFKFVATNTTHVVYVDPSSSMDAVVDVRSGACTGTSIGSSDDYSASGLETVPLNGLTIGSTYYIRVYHSKSASGDAAIPADPTFTICITSPCFYESFTGTTFPPSGWLNTSVVRSTATADYNTSPAAASYTSYNGSITTPALVNPTVLKFYLGRSSNTTAKTLTIDVSTTSQSSGFTTIATFDHSNVPVSSYNQYTVDLSAYSSNPTVWIRFTKSSGTNSPWRLDDIAVSCAPVCTPPTDPSGSITGTTPACDNTTLSFSGTAPAGEVYYWQNSATGKSTTLGDASADLSVSTSGNYYVRAFKTATNCWSTNLTGPYAVTITSSATAITPNTDQTIITGNNGTVLNVSEGSTPTSRQWMYTTTSGYGYSAFVPAQTGSSYTPNFGTAGVYYVVCASNYPSPCGTVISNEVKITAVAPGPPVITHTPLINTTSTGPQIATATIASTTPITCATLTYRVDGGAWQTPINGTLSGGVYSFSIPGQAAGSMIEYFITACNAAGTVTSPSGVDIYSPYSSFYEYTINCTPPSSGTQTIAFQGFEFVGSAGYVFAVDNTNTTPTGFQNYPAHPNAVEWTYYMQGAKGSSTAPDRNSCMCTSPTNNLTCTGLYGQSPATTPTASPSTICQYANGSNQRGVLSTNSALDYPASSRIRNGNYSYQHRQNDVPAQSMLLFDNVAIPDYTNATNIKIRVYTASISTTSGNGADNTSGNNDVVRAYVKTGTTAVAATDMVSDLSCSFDWLFPASDYSANNTLPNGTSNARWDFNGANGNQTGKNLIEITVPNYTPNVRLLVSMQNNDAREIWAVDDIQIIADYPTVTPTTGRYYRSRQNGKWNAISTWEVASVYSGPYSPACTVPDNANSDSILIMPTDTVRITAPVTADQLRVAATGKLIVENTNFTIADATATGADLVVNGTYEDNCISGVVSFNTGATWSCTSGANIIKSGSSSVVVYRDNYDGGMSTIPADANWYFKYKGVGTTNTAAVNMYYPNLYFENAANTNTYSFGSSGAALSGTTGGYCTVKGNLYIGTTGIGKVTVFNNNTNAQAMKILGDMTIGVGSTFTNTSYDGNVNTSHGHGTGIELYGNLTNNGTFTNNSNSIGILKFSGGITQAVSGSGTFNLWKVELNKTAQTLVDQQVNLTAANNLNFVGGILKTGTNVFSVSNGDALNAVTGFEAPFIATTGAPNYTNDKYVWGRLERYINSNAIYTYPVGDAVAGEGYNPLRFEQKSGTGKATAWFIAGSPGTINIGPVDVTCTGRNFYQYSGMTGEGRWHMESSDATSFTYNVYLHPNQSNSNNNPNDNAASPPYFYVDNYRALKAPAGTTDWSAYAGGGDPCIVGTYYNAPGANYTGFSDFAIPGGSSLSTALPVELTAFTGQCIEGEVLLKWTTASEFNSKEFLLQRSENGKAYQTITTIPAAGFSNMPKHYSFIDLSAKGSDYYRLVELAIDGKETVHPFIYVTCDAVNHIHVYYSTPKIWSEVTATHDKQLVFTIFDVSGKLLHTETKNISKGYNHFELNAKDHLAKGVYLIQVIDSGSLSTYKVMVE